MGKLTVFNFITLDGYYKGKDGDLSWNRHREEEEHNYAVKNLGSSATLLFGRITYEMMSGYWPTAMAMQNDPVMAEGMNKADKIVFSKTLEKAEWTNTRVVKNDMTGEIKKLKQIPGKDMCVLGSGSIISQLAEKDLIDEYQFMVNPVAIGEGTPILKGLTRKLDLQLIMTRTFKSGVILLCYQPQKI